LWGGCNNLADKIAVKDDELMSHELGAMWSMVRSNGCKRTTGMMICLNADGSSVDLHTSIQISDQNRYISDGLTSMTSRWRIEAAHFMGG
jgi:hypothetical protein